MLLLLINYYSATGSINFFAYLLKEFNFWESSAMSFWSDLLLSIVFTWNALWTYFVQVLTLSFWTSTYRMKVLSYIVLNLHSLGFLASLEHKSFQVAFFQIKKLRCIIFYIWKTFDILEMIFRPGLTESIYDRPTILNRIFRAFPLGKILRDFCTELYIMLHPGSVVE